MHWLPGWRSHSHFPAAYGGFELNQTCACPRPIPSVAANADRCSLWQQSQFLIANILSL